MRESITMYKVIQENACILFHSQLDKTAASHWYTYILMCINCSGLLCIMRGILLTFFISLKGKHFIRVVLSSSYQLGPCQLCVHTFIFINRVCGRGIGPAKQQTVSSTIYRICSTTYCIHTLNATQLRHTLYTCTM